jgi:hypothetical protein
MIAKAMHESLLPENDSLLLNVKEFCIEMFDYTGLFIIGSPTRGFRPTEAISGIIRSITFSRYTSLRIAVFDTRFSLAEINSPALRFIVKKGGYAANFMAGQIKKRGGSIIVPPEGFLVTGEKGPLMDGELERAALWAAGHIEKCQTLSLPDDHRISVSTG